MGDWREYEGHMEDIIKILLHVTYMCPLTVLANQKAGQNKKVYKWYEGGVLLLGNKGTFS